MIVYKVLWQCVHSWEEICSFFQILKTYMIRRARNWRSIELDTEFPNEGYSRGAEKDRWTSERFDGDGGVMMTVVMITISCWNPHIVLCTWCLESHLHKTCWLSSSDCWNGVKRKEVLKLNLRFLIWVPALNCITHPYPLPSSQVREPLQKSR